MQVLTLVNFFFFFNSKNVFYSCVYFFLNILTLGVFLAFFNFEFLTGFFWVVEFTVFFIFLVFYFYFSVRRNDEAILFLARDKPHIQGKLANRSHI